MLAAEAAAGRRVALPVARRPVHDVRVRIIDSEREPLRVLIAASDGRQWARLAAVIAGSGEMVVDGGEPEAADVAVVWNDDRGASDIEASPIPAVILGSWAWPDGLPVVSDGPGGYLFQDATGEEVVAALRAVAAGLSVIDPELAALLFAGATSGERTRELAPGEERLTPRETEVLQLMATGLPNKGIARELGISEHTAKYHVGAILSKLDAQSRAEAVMLAARRGWLAL